MALTKRQRRIRIKKRIRKKVNGTPETPRLSVFRSNKHIYVQLVDDISEKTLLSASSSDKDIVSQKAKDKKEKAALVGKKIADKAKDNNIASVVFDRGGYLFHGRVKALADAARKGGLKF